jgi:hypothetical protein
MMNLELDVDWEVAQRCTVAFLKEAIDTAIEWGASEYELKAYLYVLADNMYIKDFKEYAKEKNLEDYCEKIYENYNEALSF